MSVPCTCLLWRVSGISVWSSALRHDAPACHRTASSMFVPLLTAGAPCRNLVIPEPGSKRATLNGDLLIALLTQGGEYSSSRGKSFTSANLLPPDAKHYAQVWYIVLTMFMATKATVYCSDIPSPLECQVEACPSQVDLNLMVYALTGCLLVTKAHLRMPHSTFTAHAVSTHVQD